MKHPLAHLTAAQRKKYFWSFLALTLALTLVMQRLDGALKTPASPGGIVSFELAGNAQTADDILTHWDADARLHAAFGLGFDYLYMLAYAVTLALAALWARARASGIMRRAGEALAWSMGLAALADATENYFLWQMLIHGANNTAASTARAAALLKFTLLILTLLYLIPALFTRTKEASP